jgi:hypothetical protein
MNKLILAAAASFVAGAVASAAILPALGAAHTAPATAFGGLTTIYVGSGVVDLGGDDHVGTATSIHCSNVSGVTVQVRALVLQSTGAVAGALTVTLSHGATTTFSTHATFVFVDDETNMRTGRITQGVLNVEATNSAVFCTAVVVDAGSPLNIMSPLHLVRVNPHPGTVE